MPKKQTWMTKQRGLDKMFVLHWFVYHLNKVYMRVIYEFRSSFFFFQSPSNSLLAQKQWISTTNLPSAVNLLSSVASHQCKKWNSNALPGSVLSQDRLLILTGLHRLLNLGTMLPFLDEVLQGILANNVSEIPSVCKLKKKVDSKFNLTTVTVHNRKKLLIMHLSLTGITK